MEKAKILEQLIKAQGYSLKAFAEKCGIPYTTLYGILKKVWGVQVLITLYKYVRILALLLKSLKKWLLVRSKNVNRPMTMWNASLQEMESRCQKSRNYV